MSLWQGHHIPWLVRIPAKHFPYSPPSSADGDSQGVGQGGDEPLNKSLERVDIWKLAGVDLELDPKLPPDCQTFLDLTILEDHPSQDDCSLVKGELICWACLGESGAISVNNLKLDNLV